MQQVKRVNLSIAVLGHVDAGKSTLTGKLLHLTGAVNDALLNKYQQQCKQLGKQSFKYAWIVNTLRVERQRGITIELHQNKLLTSKYCFNMINTPGHRDFIKNTIIGLSQSQCAILVVAVNNGQFQAGMSREGQTREHALLAYTFGIKQLIVCCNKMDGDFKYSQVRYQEVKKEVMESLKRVGFKAERVIFVPISAWLGDNMVEKSPIMPWYKGPTLLEALDTLSPPKRYPQKPLRLTVQDVYKISGVGTVVQAKVITGILKQGMEVICAPNDYRGEVVSIEMFHQTMKQAFPGDNIGFNIRGISAKQIKRGFLFGSSMTDPPQQVIQFVAQIVVINHPGQIKAGYSPIVNCHTATVSCKIVQIRSRIDRFTGKVIEDNPISIKNGDAALVVMKPEKPMSVEVFQDYPILGRFVMRDMKVTVAVGIIKEIVKN